jgi:hypothetical protein
MARLIRLSQASRLKKEHGYPPFETSTLYAWKHRGKFPQLFIKIQASVFLDLDALDQLIEAGRGAK